MVAWVVKDFGGMIPRQDPRLLPDTMAETSINCDLAAGPLDGLPQPEFIIDLGASGAPYPVRKAYRLPDPTASDPDVWMALPSEFSSVVRSPLANDTLHAVYWTNPPNSPAPGAWWNTYARLSAHSPNYNLGFTAPGPSMITVTVTGGTYPGYEIYGADVVDRGSDYIPGETLTVIGGGANPEQPEVTFRVAATSAQNIALLNGGVGGTPPGGYTLTGATGAGTLLQVFGVVADGSVTGITGIVNPGIYTTNPDNPGHDALVGASLSGALVSYTMGVWSLDTPVFSNYWKLPPDPTPTDSSLGGINCTVHLLYNWNSAPPLIERSYCYTFVDIYGFESSPSPPSPVVSGPSDGNWVVHGLPTTVPGSPAGKNYPQVLNIRLYRTITSTSGQADFYFVADLPFGPSTYVDDTPDTTVVNNNTLQSASWLPPVDNLDGLTAMPGGMLIGFTANTVHFCEPDRPHAWPAGYDQSLLYQIVGLAVWQQSLVVLTHGYPSTGAGNAPSNFIFAQVQAPEPCIARGSIVTDLAGVYYASQNGLIMLNYFGMQNQTLSNLTRQIWLVDYKAASVIACRHRAQYLALNSPGAGFIIDYTEERMGITKIASAAGGMAFISVWNDAYVGDSYMCDTSGKIWRWDDVTTPSLNYQWRSKQFYLPAPVSLGACQISLDSSIGDPGPVPAADEPESPMATGLPVLPGGVRALFRLFAGPEGKTMTLEKYLTQPREIFRLPSGRKSFCWQFEIVANVPVHSVELASTMRELKKV
jgi:hypothetical protein